MAKIKSIHRPAELVSDKPLCPCNIRMPFEWVDILKKMAKQKTIDEHPKLTTMSDMIRQATYDRWLKI